MLTLLKTRFRARIAKSSADIEAAQRLRQLAFARDRQDTSMTLDADQFDDICTHVLVENVTDGSENAELVCCFRLLNFATADQIENSYSAQFYNLANLHHMDGPICEIGRFCLHPDWHDPDILRLAWAALTRHVDEKGITMLFGCSSFSGISADKYLDAFALMAGKYLAPNEKAPSVKHDDVFPYAQSLSGHVCDVKQAFKQLPSLLRTYLMMGGWVSDHAVIDRAMCTLHVFTGLEIAAIPAARVRQLRRDAAIEGQ